MLTGEFDRFVERTVACASIADLEAAMTERLKIYDLENNSYVTTLLGQIVRIKWANLPANYTSKHNESSLNEANPLLQHACINHTYFYWPDIAATQRLSPEINARLKDYEALGVYAGFTVPIHRPGGLCDIIWMGRRNADPIDRSWFPTLNAIALHAWRRCQEIAGKDDFMRNVVQLSRREIEIVNWIKEGKSNEEICTILNISRKTVEFHLANIQKKLNAPNRTAVVVKALQEGHIRL